MKRSAVVITVTALGIGASLGFRPHGFASQANLAGLVTGNANVAGAQTVVGTVQPLAGGLGTIQVKVTAKAGKIVSVGMAQMNLHGPQSQQISNSVIPQLQQQTLVANGGPIHGVSGATYTSQAYAQSLQAALGKFTGGPNATLATSNGNSSLLQHQGGDDGGKNDN
jgi:uncharacterized protein with FMN-binding domain